MLSLLLERAIRVFNQIREPILETPEPSQKTHPLNLVPLKPLLVLKSVLVQILQRTITDRVCARVIIEAENFWSAICKMENQESWWCNSF